MQSTLIRAALVAAAALALAACDRTSGDRTVGEKLDRAVDKTQQKLAEAGEKFADKTREVARDVRDTTVTTSRDVKDSTAEATRDARSSDTGRAMSDTAITASIKTDFIKDPDLSVFKIDVDTKDGVVTLNGLAGNDAAKQRAEKMASSVKGVKEVRNYLTIKRA